MTTAITHVPSGEFLQKSNAQQYGSFMTYMRRYSICALLGLVTDDDDDGNAASADDTAEPQLDTALFNNLQSLIRGSASEEGLKKNMEEVNKYVPQMSVAQKQAITLLKDTRKEALAK